MQKNLFLLCPTDCLEFTINKAFKHENYFYTSLANSFAPDIETLESIKDLILKRNINKIYFVLSNENQLIVDALEGRFFYNIKGLKVFYNEIIKQKKYSDVWSQTSYSRFMLLSCYLNKKIKELEIGLNNFYPAIQISGKIYNKHQNVFNTIYSSLICAEKFYLN
jgi:hypothetical protein